MIYLLALYALVSYIQTSKTVEADTDIFHSICIHIVVLIHTYNI